MSRPCWPFLQAGHSLTSVLMRHPFPPIRRPLSALQAGPAVPGAEHFREVVHPIEVFDLVARLSRQQADVDQGEDDVAEVLGAGDPPVAQHGGREQPELVEREVATGPGELRPAQVAACGQLALGVLERREHEQVAALVVAAVLLADPLERFLQRREVAHGRTSRLPGLRARTSTDRATRGSSSASSSTSSSVSTGLISSSFFTSSGTSTMSLWLRAGTTTVLTPARAAAVSFSLSPPIGSTRPRSVSSPVIATSWRAGRWHNSDASAVAIVIPADGPSLGTAPAGTCRCTSVCVNASSGIPSAPARARNKLHAACADSFITSPSCPVKVIWPFPGIWIASMNMMSPPTGVHARPVATPTSGLRPATSLCTLGWPAYFSRFFAVTFTVVARPSTTSSAALRSTPWISRSSWRTPASRVYSAISRSSAASARLARSGVSPVSLNCRGSRKRFAIASFSPGGYPGRVSTSMRSSKGSGIGARLLAVAMNMTPERSNGTSR